MTPTAQGWVFLCLPVQGESGSHRRKFAYRMPLPASLHHEPPYCVCAHGMCCRMHEEGVAVTFDFEVPKSTTPIEHHLRSFRHLSEAFFSMLPCDLQLCNAEWKAIEHATVMSDLFGTWRALSPGGKGIRWSAQR